MYTLLLLLQIFRLDVLSQHDVEEAEREIVPRQHFERNQRERRQIKHPPTDVKCSDIPFVVNRQSLQIKRKGYEAGASDSEEDSSDSGKAYTLLLILLLMNLGI